MMSKTSPLVREISVVIPAYNEEKIIEDSIRTLIAHMDGLHLDKYEVVISENGSTDRTLDLAKKFATGNLKVISSAKRGFGNAIRKGVAEASMENIVVYPLDLCYDIHFIEKSMEQLDKYPVVFGVRYKEGCTNDRPAFRLFISKMHTRLVNFLFSAKFNDVDCLKAYKAYVGKKMVANTNANDAFIEVEISMMVKNGSIPYAEIATSHVEKEAARHPSYFFKMIARGTVSLFTNYSRLKALKVECS